MSDGLLQALLAAEHAAVYGYGVLGARLPDALRARALDDETAHRASRDRLTVLLSSRGAAAPATRAAYDVTVATPEEAFTLAVRLEEGLGVRWRDLVGGTDEVELRRLGLVGLTGSAVRAATWRASTGAMPPTVALPGLAPPD